MKLKKLLINFNNDSLLELEAFKKEIEIHEKLMDSSDINSYLYLDRLLKKKSLHVIPKRKIETFIDRLDLISKKINYNFDKQKHNNKNLFSLSSIKLAVAIQKYLNSDTIKNVQVIDYSVSKRKSTLSLLVNENKIIAVNTKKLKCDSYLTNELLDKIWDQDISVLWNLQEEDKILLINNFIEDLTSSIDDEITKLAIKSKLSRLINTKINLADIKYYFMESLVKFEQDNLNDGALKDIYSQKFYKQLIGNRDEDNKISFEIIKNIKMKSPNEDLVMIFFDVNNFKSLNDEYSHDVGDMMLQHISKQLMLDVKDKGIVSRRGGDEFVVIAPINIAKELIYKEFSRERVDNNNKIFNKIIGEDNNKIDISLTCGVKKIPNCINEKNCSLMLHQCDIESDTKGLEHKAVSHYLNGSSRDKKISDEEYHNAKIKLIKNLYDELDITKINIWGKEDLVLSEKIIDFSDKEFKMKIDDLQFRHIAQNGKYFVGINEKTNEELTKRRENVLSFK